MPTPTAKRTALITGCNNGGLGAAIALALKQADFHVFATARNPAKASALLTQPHDVNSPGTIELLALDVTSQPSITECAALVAPLLDADLAQARKVFDVNVWGVVAVAQAFSEMLIRAKGAILNISSLAGAAKLAWQGNLSQQILMFTTST
ncbi:hypothetical protein BDW74DRAFT_172334 [Aspergillus multicolor]|uniref:uncharacterized protein n=1 Tax=Aspergillus multicolor TaxID=41759 RepID=UPI003CCE34D9